MTAIIEQVVKHRWPIVFGAKLKATNNISLFKI